MLKMILADDESLVREGLRNIIAWEDYGIEIIAAAADGQEAVELCQQLLPDILFTDIRMPFLDGLEVAARLQEQGLDIKVIIFSGVQDFGYAKSALNINAEGYILKPLDVAELTSVVAKVVKKIITERNLAEKIEQLKQQLNESFGAAREKFLRNLFRGVYKDAAEIHEKLEYFKNPFNAAAPVTVAVLEIDEYAKTVLNNSEAEKQLLSFSVTGLVEELLNSYSRGVCILMNDNEFVMLFEQTAGAPLEPESDLLNEIVNALSTYLNISVSVGVGRRADQVGAINQAYLDALQALQFKFYTGKGSIIKITDISTELETAEYPGLYEAQNQLVNYLRSGNVAQTQAAVEKLFAGFSVDRKYTIDYIQRICAELVSVISRALYEIGADIGDLASKRPAIFDTIYKTESIFELKQQLSELVVKIAAYFERKFTQKNNKLIAEIKSLIDAKYMEELSVNRIAEAVYLSPNYMSLMFKRETGETLTDYLTKKRMEVARELLQTTDYKILDIANLVGFQDASYFSKVFKKQTGVHPQKYRTGGNS